MTSRMSGTGFPESRAEAPREEMVKADADREPGTSASSAPDVQVCRPPNLSSVLPRTDYGTLDENMKMTDCYFEKKDWRKCTAEVQSPEAIGVWMNGLIDH